MTVRGKNENDMPDVPDPDFVGTLSEIWFAINYAAYHLAYIRVYLQTSNRLPSGVSSNWKMRPHPAHTPEISLPLMSLLTIYILCLLPISAVSQGVGDYRKPPG
jgi:hypothetical protein